MLGKLPIRLRLTAISVLLLTLCCVGLTVILNLSATQMADVIEATPMLPAMTAGEAAAQTAMTAGEAAAQMEMTALVPSEGAQVARNRFQYQSIVYMALVILAGGALTYYMTGKALVPLQQLSAQMKNRTVHNLAEALEVPESRDELAELTRSFNQMSQKLDEAFAMQKRFSQSAAHELRTPLTVLKTKVEVFQKKAEHTPADYDSVLAVVTHQTDRMAALVQDLLGLAHMEATACTQDVELKALLLEAVQELGLLAAEKKVAVTVEGAPCTVAGNAALLHRAFCNLLENALKYNVEGGAVHIRVERAEERARVSIADTGLGIPVEARPLIFEPFFRADRSRSRQIGGAGLGLAIVKAIIEKHNGTVELAPASGGGTTFFVRL